MKLRRLATLLAAPVAVAATLTIPVGTGAASAAPGDSSCPSVQLLTIPGTWETDKGAGTKAPPKKGMLNAITDPLSKKFSPQQLQVEFVPYEATAFDKGVAYADSKATGVAQTLGMIASKAAKCPSTKFSLTGYSQGADVAGDVASIIANGKGPIPKTRLGTTYTLADPGRGTKGEIQLGPKQPGTGIAGPRSGGYPGIKVITVCADKDRYCSIDPKDPSQKLMATVGSVLAGASKTRTGQALSSTRSAPIPALSAQALQDLPGKASDLTTSAKALSSGGIGQFGVDYSVPGTLDQSGNKSVTDLKGLAGSAKSIFESLTPVMKTASALKSTPKLQKDLDQAPEGSPNAAGRQVLAAAEKVDFKSAGAAVKTLSAAADKNDTASAESAITQFSSAIQPLASMDPKVFDQGASVMGILQPASSLGQLSSITDLFSKFDPTKTSKGLEALPAALMSGDINKALTSVNGLNSSIEPLVNMADNTDLGGLSQLVKTAGQNGSPEVQQATGVASQVIDIVNRMDLTALHASIVGVQKALMNIVSNPTSLPQELPNIITSAMGIVGMGSEVMGMPSDLAPEALLKAATTLNPSELISGAIDIGSFYQNGAHGNYFKLPVEGTNPMDYGIKVFSEDVANA